MDRQLCQDQGKVGGSRKKFSGRERRAEGRVRLHRARGSAEFREIASGSATQGFWLRNKKEGSQLRGVDRRDSLGEEQLGKLGEEKDQPAIERRKEYTDLGFDLGEREEQVVCHFSALATTDEARREVEMEA